ncbi:conserved hypothetical protein [Culex quinquefasciatus]|uniref:Chitin-binding type-2 domain-containing protein n=1 Tax=Culex quinquefasciatus TaxID=7176 RepID=B0X3J6_CULQU|nr:conserved hypothetical protein [Culex quinquefasciatus]|eukprot:XP_001864218.1 conserved hypothetical protein [Culex quinquefasciatus]
MKTWRACLGAIGVLLVLTCQVTSQILSDEFVQGIHRQLRTGENFDDPKPCAPGQLTVCVGCKNIKICIGAETDDGNPEQACPAATPHCNSEEGGVCSTIPDPLEECAAAATDFTCTAIGKFPDPYTCDGYYYCETVGGIGDAYKCPTGYNYNSKVQLCQRAFGAFGGCQTVNCTGVTAIFTQYPGNPQYFFYCKPGADDMVPKEPIMFSCGDGASFDVKENKCIYKCPREGLFKKEGSPASYYQCYFAGGRLVAKEKKCPGEDQVFDDKKKTCLKSTMTESFRKQVSSG